MRSSDSLSKIAPALVVALSEIEGAAKSGENSAFKRDGKATKYTTLEAVIEASRDVLAKHDLALMQFPGALTGGALTLETVIMHKSGEWISGDFQIALGKVDPQGVGSALTYARRYAQKAALNMPDLDDDAEAAHGRHNGHPVNDERNGAGPSPEGPDWWGCSGSGMTAHAAKGAKLDVRHEDMRAEIGRLSSSKDWTAWCKANTDEIAKMPKAWRVILRAEAEEMAKELGVDLNQRRAA